MNTLTLCSYLCTYILPYIYIYTNNHSIYILVQGSNFTASNFLAQRGSNALLLAALGGSVEVVRVLIEEFDSSVDEANNVSVSPTVYAGLACSNLS